jgi:hypothetical protein
VNTPLESCPFWLDGHRVPHTEEGHLWPFACLILAQVLGVGLPDTNDIQP